MRRSIHRHHPGSACDPALARALKRSASPVLAAPAHRMRTACWKSAPCVGIISRWIGECRFAGHANAYGKTYDTDRRRPHKVATGKASMGRICDDW
jgi:hypothetical protein